MGVGGTIFFHLKTLFGLGWLGRPHYSWRGGWRVGWAGRTTVGEAAAAVLASPTRPCHWLES